MVPPAAELSASRNSGASATTGWKGVRHTASGQGRCRCRAPEFTPACPDTPTGVTSTWAARGRVWGGAAGRQGGGQVEGRGEWPPAPARTAHAPRRLFSTHAEAHPRGGRPGGCPRGAGGASRAAVGLNSPRGGALQHTPLAGPRLAGHRPARHRWSRPPTQASSWRLERGGRRCRSPGRAGKAQQGLSCRAPPTVHPGSKEQNRCRAAALGRGRTPPHPARRAAPSAEAGRRAARAEAGAAHRRGGRASNAGGGKRHAPFQPPLALLRRPGGRSDCV